jgi:uncharacterized protein (TIGR02996 family)
MTHDDFLRAIIESPDDDAPRLVFADWLDEHGETERAEFIRVQIELATLPKSGRRTRLEEREKELLARHEEEWVKPIRKRVVSWVFRRGFVAEVGVTLQAYMKHTYEVIRVAPIRRLCYLDPGSGRSVAVDISLSAFDLVPESIARECRALPLGHHDGRHLLVAVASPVDIDVLRRLAFVTNRNIAAVEAPAEQLEAEINRHYGQSRPSF